MRVSATINRLAWFRPNATIFDMKSDAQLRTEAEHEATLRRLRIWEESQPLLEELFCRSRSR